jgi:uncharacterized protein YggE
MTCRTAVLAIVLVSTPLTTAAHEAPERPLITVTGQGEVRIPPDEAILRLRVVTLDKDLALAKSRNDESVKATLALVRERGVKPEHVQTGGLRIDARESEREGQKPVFIGHEVTRPITVAIKDLKQADDLLTAVVKSGVNRVDAFELHNSELRRHRDQARALAIRAAREKAAALTKEIGQTIGKAFSITETNPPWAGASNRLQTVAFVDSVSEGDDGAFSAGENAITATVTVSFELQ